MAHCKICDYSQDIKSMYYSGLQMSEKRGKKLVVFDEATESYLCTECLQDIKQCVRNTEEREAE